MRLCLLVILSVLWSRFVMWFGCLVSCLCVFLLYWFCIGSFVGFGVVVDVVGFYLIWDEAGRPSPF